MSDEQEQQAQAQEQQPYPHFPPTSEGLALLYREYGRLQHMTIEQELLIGRLTAHGQRVLEAANALQDQHAPGKCQPTAELVDMEPAPALHVVEPAEWHAGG